MKLQVFNTTIRGEGGGGGGHLLIGDFDSGTAFSDSRFLTLICALIEVLCGFHFDL